MAEVDKKTRGKGDKEDRKDRLAPPHLVTPSPPHLVTPSLAPPHLVSKMHALSIPTWIIHVSSVIEWISAIWLIWIYGEVTREKSWFALSFAMLPALISAMCACTWHFFDNAESLEWLVTLQAALTLVGNITLLAAAWWIWRATKITANSAKIEQ